MNQTLLGMLDGGARAASAGPALIERRGEAYVEVSHPALRAAIDAAARALVTSGVRKGDVIGVWLPNGLDYLAAEFAAAAMGAAVLGINTRYGVFELSNLMTAGRLTAIVLPARFLDLDFAGRLGAGFATARDAIPDLVAPSILVADADGADLARFDIGGGAIELALEGPAAPCGDAGEPSAAVNYFTTSGSTGAPKLAGHDQQSVTIHSPLIAAAFDMRPGDVVLGVLPFCGVFGFNIAMAALASGATCLVDPMFDARAALAAMARFKVTQAFGGDDLFARLHEVWLEDPVDLPHLRRGAIAEFEGRAATLAAWARASFGAELTGVYGSSEVLSFAMSRPVLGDCAAQVKGGGLPLSDRMAFRIADPETGAILPRGAPGELQARGYNVLLHYLGNPAATARAFTADGWFRTGDLASDDGEAGFTFLCRNSDALRLRGFLVEPAEIEQFLMSHPGVDTARVVGVRTARGDAPVGFVTVTDKTLTGEALVRFCKSGLAAFKAPARVEILDSFPVTVGTNGAKIRTEELKRIAQDLVVASG
ncbi:MAG: AMP-binding protein [Caulobacteraceae bacterium]|jgi:acyl-CoA synthetase (AMP-forming)/AMP-acid ligase II|nr:AMP-binding protein [Caulobacteraceae bacterium]